MLISLFYFVLSAVAIYCACEYFVNAVEWCGRRLKLGAMAVGAVLAAFGTALPESAVTFMASVLGHTAGDKQLGVGAAMGGPLVLSTLSYAVVGLALLLNRPGCTGDSCRVSVDNDCIRHDQKLFLGLFAVEVGLGLVSFPGKRWMGLLFLAAYGLYVWRKIDGDGAALEGKLEPLKLRPGVAEPSLGWSAFQALAALAVIAWAAHLFVAQLGTLGSVFGWSPQLTALVLSPVATELPETLNAWIWVRQGKEQLALANITGAMMIQATVPSAIGILFTPWRFDAVLLVSGLITIAAMALLWLLFRRRSIDARVLVAAGSLYLLFAFLVGLRLVH